MEELMLMMAKMLPENEIITDLKATIDEYLNATGNKAREHAKSMISLNCMLFNLKLGTEKQDIVESIKDLQNHKANAQLFKNKKN